MCYYLIGQKAVGDGHGLDLALLIGAQACPNFLALFFSSILGAASPRDGNLPSPIAQSFLPEFSANSSDSKARPARAFVMLPLAAVLFGMYVQQ